MINPIEVVKIRLQIQGELQQKGVNVTKHYKGFIHGLATIAREEGLNGLYKG